MRLMHSTISLKNVIPIMLGGLKPSRITGRREYPQSDEDLVYFLALDEKSLANHRPVWGKYHFLLNKEFVRENSGQFRAHAARYRFDNMFKDFAERLGLRPYGKRGKDSARQTVSLKPVLMEGLETIILDRAVPEDEKKLVKEASPMQMKFYVQILFKKLERIK